MKNYLAPTLAVFMLGGLSVALAQPPLPTVVAAPMLSKSVIMQGLKRTFAYKKPVRVGALMTKREKKAYLRAMQSARNAEARRQIRELAYAKLHQRAIEQGMYVVVPINHTAQAARAEVAPQLREPVRVMAVNASAPRPAVVAAHPVRQPPHR